MAIRQPFALKKRYTHPELQKWLFQVAQRASTTTARDIILKDIKPRRGIPTLGKLYFFKYDPLWKAILPQYDMFPLSFVIDNYTDGFLGLNLHYLPIAARAALIDELMEFANNEKMDETTKLVISYRILKAWSMTFELAKPCIKRYLFTQVRSKFIEVIPSEWDRAVQLDVSDFVYAR